MSAVGFDTAIAADAGACEAIMTATAAKVEIMAFLNIVMAPVMLASECQMFQFFDSATGCFSVRR